MDKQTSINIATDTLKILENGFYILPNGKVVHIKEPQFWAMKNTVLYRPNKGIGVPANVANSESATFEFTLETTLQAGKRLFYDGHKRTACLNFASAKNPGGGFLRGTTTQEESLVKASGLYPCISKMKEMYAYNRNFDDGLSSDYMIFSPEVPVFKDDNGTLLDDYHLLSFITAPAVNMNCVDKPDEVPRVMQSRIDKIINLGVLHKQEAMVLGAFGCGVFKNDPYKVATYFKKSLERPEIRNRFKKVVFAIIDKRMLDIFKSIIGGE